ncbi:MAG: ankyrin repeat domain-containing protein [Fimbriimonadaceae bacterium]
MKLALCVLFVLGLACLGESSLEAALQAATRDDAPALEALLQASPSLAKARLSGERTLLHEAAGANASRCIALLGRFGAEVHAKDWALNTPLHLAAGKGAVAALLRLGANVAGKNAEGSTPLHEAACRPDADVLATLLGAGADARATDSAGRTPLHRASAWGMEANVRALLKAGGSVWARDAGLQTPLHQARTLPVVEALVRAGAPRTWRDRRGDTPEQALRAAGETEGADYLRSL